MLRCVANTRAVSIFTRLYIGDDWPFEGIACERPVFDTCVCHVRGAASSDAPSRHVEEGSGAGAICDCGGP